MTPIDWIKRARARGCPLLALSTPEPHGLVDQYRESNPDSILYSWDCASGIRAQTRPAHSMHGIAENCNDPEQFLIWCQMLPERTVVLAHWHTEFFNDAPLRQHLLNLRDMLKAGASSLVLVGRNLHVHPGLQQDFLLHEDALPDAVQLRACIGQTEQNAGCDALSEDDRERAVDTLRGMTLFQAEQHLAMAARKEGIDISKLWQDKVHLINQTPGLSVWRGGEQPTDVAGLNGIMSYLQLLKGGKIPPRLVVWIDESEDMLAGTQGDTSGISQDYLGRLAGHIQDTRAQCLLLNGHPGTGKSLTAKVAGSLFDCLVLALDLGACKGSLVGESENNLRHALAVERAIVGQQTGSTLWIWTTNNAEALPPKLRSRMQAEFFSDLPGEQEQLAIWSLYRHKYEIPSDQSFPACDGWVGREIERCCRLAWQLNVNLQEAARYVVPSAISQKQNIEERKKRAINRYLDASKGGVFSPEMEKSKRKIDTKA